MRARIPILIAMLQSILFAMHFFIYETWMFFWGTIDSSGLFKFRVMLAFLSISFVATSLLAFRYSNVLVRIFYTLSAVWLGLGNYFLLASSACWIVYIVPALFGTHVERRPLAVAFLSLAVLTGIYGIVNASWTRVKHVVIKLPNLPDTWQGRTVALVSDWHLGHVRNRGFIRRILRMVTRLRPDALFIMGDLYDGSAVDFDRLAVAWDNFSLPLGSYFITGNHEEFSSRTEYLDAVTRSGIRVLNNEKILLDGLQLVGVHYRESTDVRKFRAILEHASLDSDVASVLLVHTPDHLAVAEAAGISLQLSGHTHRGQFFPFTLIVRRIYGQYAYGLSRFGNLSVFTSCGAGTWGPPFRVGTTPEIVLIRFE